MLKPTALLALAASFVLALGCSAPVDTDESVDSSESSLTRTPPALKILPPRGSSCMVTGCSGEICAPQAVTTTCAYRPEYACYATATCALQANGQCGWTATTELSACLASGGGTTF